ncbi:VOC family protein [Sphingomonas bacterium]|uniref:VOC family protein n=1 Tax=Sphingomonas bacterium TaxID=1895847 RepID=UPI00157623CE|nr:VOC family protein [Sphingomonas bacterium]
MTGDTIATRSAVTGIDHVAITVADIDETCAFYTRVLDADVFMDHKIDGRTAVRGIRIGGAMLNVHRQGNGIDLVARLPTPGSADLCFRWGGDIASAKAMLAEAGVPLREGPVPRTSSRGVRGQSVYFLDPDGNLIELLAED